MAIHLFAAIEVGTFALELGIFEISSKFGVKEIEDCSGKGYLYK